jgi:hypothetical protein
LQRCIVSGTTVYLASAILPALQWAPTLAFHDPNPPINLESPSELPQLLADSAAFVETAQPVSLEVGRKLQADSAAFVETAQTVSLKVGRKLQAGSAAFTETAADAGLRRTRLLAAASAAFVETAQDVSLVHSGMPVVVGSGAVGIAGTLIAQDVAGTIIAAAVAGTKIPGTVAGTILRVGSGAASGAATIEQSAISERAISSEAICGDTNA